MTDLAAKIPDNRIHLFDPVGLINDNYGGYRASSYAVRPRRATTSYDSSVDTNDGGLRLGIENMVDEESDDSTPRLWKGSPPMSPKFVSSPSHFITTKSINSPPYPGSPKSVSSAFHVHPYHPMSPSSRTQAIAKGRRELMEMVRDLPESFYELSLKDIVEQKAGPDVQSDNNLTEEKKFATEVGKINQIKQKKTKKKISKSESKAKMVRSRSIDNGGFLLKTSVFPILLGSRKSKRSLASNASFKVAPKPPTTPRSLIKGGSDKDWWRRRSCISSESDQSNGLSSNRGSSGSSSSSSRSNSSNGRYG